MNINKTLASIPHREASAIMRQLGVSMRPTGYGDEIRVTLIGIPRERAEAIACYESGWPAGIDTALAMARSTVHAGELPLDFAADTPLDALPGFVDLTFAVDL